MKNPNKNHTTHYACDEILKRDGGKAVGCCCTGHKCKIPKDAVIMKPLKTQSNWKNELKYNLDAIIENMSSYDGEMIEEDALFERVLEFNKQFIENLLDTQRVEIIKKIVIHADEAGWDNRALDKLLDDI